MIAAESAPPAPTRFVSILQAPAGGDAELVAILREVRTVFLRNARRQVEEVQREWTTTVDRVIDRANMERFARTIHTIKGTAGSVGLPVVSTAAAEVEGLLRNDEATLGTALPEAVAYLANLIGNSDNT